MTSTKTADYYDRMCHVLDGDTVIVQGSRFVRERTCNDIGGDDFFACSKCGAQLETINPTYGYENIQDGKANYCPNCGARVVEE